MRWRGGKSKGPQDSASKVAARRLTPGETSLLAHAQIDDIDLGWAFIELGIDGSSPAASRHWRPSSGDLDVAFATFGRLIEQGLIKVGRFETRHDREGVVHIPEPLPVVRERVESALANANARDETEWKFAGWVVAAGGADLDLALAIASFHQFLDAAEEYCDVLDTIRGYRTTSDAVLAISTALSALITAALGLPDVEPTGDEGRAEVAHADWSAKFSAINEALADRGVYWTTMAAGSGNEPDVVQLPLADDLADIWRDVEGGLRAHRDGANPIDVLWEWRFTFHSHWGAHATEALRGLHSLATQ